MPNALRIAVFVAAIFSSACLIFVVQPLVGKRILPWFGGTPGVWSLCLAFYQTALFLGYVYAHGLIRFARKQRGEAPSALSAAPAGAWARFGALGLHAGVLLLAALSLPILPPLADAPTTAEAPEWAILSLLLGRVALPFIALAATGPLVQAWFAESEPARSPYVLYAVSNLGSLLGLFGYSFVLEPNLALEATGRFWSAGFLACAGLVLGSGALAARSRAAHGAEPGPSPGPAEDPSAAIAVPGFVWALLAGSAVILLNGLSNELTLDVASAPFLWVLMLAAYLVSFILAFGSEQFYPRVFFLPATGLLLLAIYAKPLVAPASDGSLTLTGSTSVQIGLYVLLLFCSAMVLHGELYRLRPGPHELTRFYVYVSGGGALGGLFVGLLAPHVFDGFHEVFVGFSIGWLTLLFVGARLQPRNAQQWAIAALGTLVVFGPQIGQRIAYQDPLLVHKERSFFGVLRVRELRSEAGVQRQLMNGTTQHGLQRRGGGFDQRPTAYFGVHTGIGLALRQRSAGPPQQIGIVGLGIGTLAAYGRPADRIRFFEIDPAITRLARDAGYFSCLEESAATIEISEGDARLLLDRERAAGAPLYDVLIVDAFTSDAIPIHLLTREAFELYQARLRDGGLLALHISNRHFELQNVIARIGQSIGAEAMVIENEAMPRFLSERSKWIFLSQNPRQLARLAQFAGRALQARQVAPANLKISRIPESTLLETAIWTDDYSDILSALRRPEKPGFALPQ